MKTFTLFLSSILGLAAAQDLATALQAYPDASQFASRLDDLADDLITTGGRQYTLLIPTNEAFRNFATAKGQNISSLPQAERRTYLRYHVLVGALTSSNFSAPKGLTVPTLLKDTQYNNRTAGAALTEKFGANASGQVLFIQKDALSSASIFRVRRQTQAGGITVGGGLVENATLNAVDGTWSGGKFQIINEVLEPPAPCSKTIRTLGTTATALDTALNRTGLWNTLDTTKNVTCLLPNTAAFATAGNPQNSLSQADLVQAILLHTITAGPVYSDFITDGQTYKSANNLTIRITSNSTGTWFNDARVLQQNVLTNNGLVHVLDKVMSPIANEKLPVTGNGTGTDSTTKPSAATGVNTLLKHSYVAAAAGVVVALLL